MTVFHSKDRKVVLLTQSCFWVKGNGLATRTHELVRFLAPRFDLSIAFLGTVSELEIAMMRAMGLNFNLFILGVPQPALATAPAQILIENFRKHFNETTPPATYIVVQTEHSFMLQAIPANGRKMLDTIDLISDRTRTMAQHGVRDHYPLSEEQEAAIFRNYDYVMFIQPQEHAKACAWIGADKALLVPHPVAVRRHILRDTVRSIGLAASRWHPNVDGLKWFIECVWPHFHGRNISLDVYGFVSQTLDGYRAPGLCLHGFVDDLGTCYSQIDIAINPVRYGAGLKIKSIEAMAHGLPLVASAQGASGLEEVSGQAFLLASNEHEYVAALEALIRSLDLRRSLGEQASAYVAGHFSFEQCFSVLAERICA